VCRLAGPALCGAGRHSDKPSLHDVRYHVDPSYERRSRISYVRTFGGDGPAISPSAEPNQVWWSQTGSNRRPPACKAGALPTELWPRWSAGLPSEARIMRARLVGPGRVELPTSRLSGVRSNHLSYGPPFRKDAGFPIAEGRRSRSLGRSRERNASAKKEKRRRRRPANWPRDFGA
jgi:hypothetical protein